METHNSNPELLDRVVWTHLQGEVDVSYAELKQAFGKPLPSGKFDEYKVDAEWVVRDPESGVVATIYNYKSGKNYNGRSGTPKTLIRDWHIGGTSERSVEIVKRALGL